LPGLVEN